MGTKVNLASTSVEVVIKYVYECRINFSFQMYLLRNFIEISQVFRVGQFCFVKNLKLRKIVLKDFWKQ